MGFCTDAEYEEFFRTVPEFEKMLVRSGIQLVKYWFSIPDEEQEFRFRCRINDPLKQWKLSPMDLESRRRWELYTKAKEVMFERTHMSGGAAGGSCRVRTRRRRASTASSHLLSLVNYTEVEHEPIVLPPRVHHPDYRREPIPQEMIVPEIY